MGTISSRDVFTHVVDRASGDAYYDLFKVLVWPMISSLLVAAWGFAKDLPGPINFVIALNTAAIVLYLYDRFPRKEKEKQLKLQGVERQVLPATVTVPLEELEETIRKWLDDFQYRVQRRDGGEEKHFSLIAQGDSNNHVEVMRLKRIREQFIILRGSVRIDGGDPGKLVSFSEKERRRILYELTAELNRQKISHTVIIPQGIQVETRVAITGLTQEVLINKVNDIDFAISLTIGKVRLLLDYDEHKEGREDSVNGVSSAEGLSLPKPPEVA